ncbi:MAG: winged helix DNA-binding domain-containing protein [Aeromicrobium sp.]
MRRITVDERRARLGLRHALADQGAADVVDAARAVVGLHGTDPASTFLAALARTPGATTDDVERALYDDRTLVRILAMRRTLFAVPREDVGIVLVGAGADIGRQQRTLLAKMLVESEVTDDPGPWVDRAEAAALAAMDGAGEIMSTELAKADPLLGTRVEIAPGTKYATTASIASRMLTLMSADGKVVRTRPRGGWTSTQFRWATLDDWIGQVERPDTATASSEMARLWLRSYGPASLDDLQWWTGWTKTRTRAALATLDTVEVDLDGSPGLLLADDAEPVPAPDPWVALLPALDPSAMGWKHRDFCLGPHREQLYDINGNAGPTVWADGRMIGGWAQRDDGEVVVRLLDDVGAESAARIEERAAALTAMLGDVRLKARARGWTPVERELRA